MHAHTHTNLYPLSSEAGELDVWVAGQVGPGHIVRAKQNHRAWDTSNRTIEAFKQELILEWVIMWIIIIVFHLKIQCNINVKLTNRIIPMCSPAT